MKNEGDFHGKPPNPESDFPDIEKCSQDEKEELLFLTGMLRDMPDREPPLDLAETVLRSVRPKRLSAWRRLYLWAAAPRSITVSPIKLIPVATVTIVLALFLTMHFFTRQKSPLYVNRGEQKLVSITFTFDSPQARSVSLIGSFNQWKPGEFTMRPRGEEDVWVLELRLPEGRHEYAFLVDGKMLVTDPSARFSQDDGFGNKNSILFVTEYEEQAI